MPEETPPLTEYFTAEDAGKEWHLRCRICKKGWALAKSSNHPGNLLHLLDHAHSHPESDWAKISKTN